MTTQARFGSTNDRCKDYNLPNAIHSEPTLTNWISGAMRITGTDPTTVKTDPTRN